jgi:hypothetical protein
MVSSHHTAGVLNFRAAGKVNLESWYKVVDCTNVLTVFIYFSDVGFDTFR